jgi:predicted nucleic acid-binding protein
LTLIEISSVLIDTNVWSELSKPRPDQSVNDFISHHFEDAWLSALVLGEMRYGIARLTDAARRERLVIWFDDLTFRLEERTLNFDASAAQAYAHVKARLTAAGTLIAELDMLIAAQAIAADMPLVTRNLSDMGRTGATIINPWQP